MLENTLAVLESALDSGQKSAAFAVPDLHFFDDFRNRMPVCPCVADDGAPNRSRNSRQCFEASQTASDRPIDDQAERHSGIGDATRAFENGFASRNANEKCF